MPIYIFIHPVNDCIELIGQINLQILTKGWLKNHYRISLSVAKDLEFQYVNNVLSYPIGSDWDMCLDIMPQMVEKNL